MVAVALANVVMREVSSPAPGSVTPKQTCRSPLTIRGSVAAFISSEPNTTTGCIPKIDMWMELAAFMAPPERATSSASSVASVMPSPWPPYSSGIGHPEPAALGDGVVELLRELVGLVLLHPVLVVEA